MAYLVFSKTCWNILMVLVSTFFLLFLALSLLGVFPVILLFYLNDAEFVIESAL